MVWGLFIRKIRLWQLAICAILTGLAGCSPTFEAAPLTPVLPTPMGTPELGIPVTPQEEIMETASPSPTGSPFENWVQLAKEDLAGRLGVGVEQIELVSAEAVVWPDGSLGCPQPGMAYTQVQQEGLRIVLRAVKKEYAYHSGGSRPPFLCENPAGGGSPAPDPGSDT